MLKLARHKAVQGGRPRLENLVRGWIHQSFLYLDTTERLARMALEATGMALLAGILSFLVKVPIWNWRVLGASFLVVHTAQWILNGNWWAGLLFAFPGLRNPGEEATCRYLNDMAVRLRPHSAISGLLIFGSVSRGRWHDRSDIDLRLLRCPGFWNAIKAVLLLSLERTRAFFARQPLDIYLGDDVGFFQKMRKDEIPIFLISRDVRLSEAYPGAKEEELITLQEGLKVKG